MTQLVLDPPPRSLRLVVSNDDATQRPTPVNGNDRASRGPQRRYRNEAVLGRGARALYRRTLEWSLEQGAQVNPDALRVILAARQDRHHAPPNRYTTEDIWRLMMVDVVAWCRARRLAIPEGGAHALRALLAMLHGAADFHPDSDDLHDLDDAIDECTGGWTDPHEAPSSHRPW